MKKISLFWRIVICSVGVLVLATAVLWMIPLNNAPALANADVDYIEITAAGQTQPVGLENSGTLKEGFNSVKSAYNKSKQFSVLRGILVGKVSGVTVDDEDDALTPAKVSALKGDTATAMIMFRYAKMQTQTIKGVTYEFNRAKVLVSDSDGDIGTFRVVLYDSRMLANGSGDLEDENYTTRGLTCYGNGTTIINALEDILSE